MNDEQFFEQLAGGRAPASEETFEEQTESTEPEIELAKANTAAASLARARASKPKIVETESEKTWDETEPAGELTVDVYQTPDDIVVESAIAGVKPDDIDIQVTADSISIKGSRHRAREVSDDDYLCQECYWGKFARTVIFPQEINPEGAAVAFKNGILTVRLPKVNKRKSRNLKIKLD
jgi:HSP20 family protein